MFFNKKVAEREIATMSGMVFQGNGHMFGGLNSKEIVISGGFTASRVVNVQIDFNLGPTKAHVQIFDNNFGELKSFFFLNQVKHLSP